MTDRPATWGVVGGGLLGMTLALRLAQRGQQVTLLEAADHLGGLADAWSFGGITWDRHYHVTLLSDTHLRRLLAELDLERDMRWVETKTGVYADDRLVSLSNSWEFLRFPPLGLIDKARLAWTIWHASRVADWQSLENIPVADWLQKHSGRRTWEKLWLPLLRSKLGDSYRRTSAAFIWATIQRMYAARRTGLKREMFGYVRGGYTRVLAALETRLRELGVTILTGAATEQLGHDDGRTTLTLADGRSLTFDRVALTIPSPAIARMCPQLTEQEREQHQGIEYQGIVCASLLVDRPLSPYYVTNVTAPWAPFTGVIEMTALVDPVELGGKSLVYLPKYVAPDDPLFARPDAEIEAEFVAALTRMHPTLEPQHVLACRISRVRRVFALSTLGYSQRLPPIETSLPGVFAVNSAQIVNGTLNVNETVKLAEAALERQLLAQSTAPVRQPAGVA